MPNAVDLINRLIEGIEFAILTSSHPNGHLHSRPMLTQQVTPDGALWFFSNVHSSKVDDIRHSNQVNVAYADPEGNRYVSVSGTCEVVRNAQFASELWNSAYRRWFPKGLDDPDLILLKVTINVAEYWEADTGRMLPVLIEGDQEAGRPAGEGIQGTLRLRDERKDIA